MSPGSNPGAVLSHLTAKHRRGATALAITSMMVLLGWPQPGLAYQWPGRLAELRSALESRAPADRRRAVEALSAYPIDEVRELLAEAVHDPVPAVQVAAIKVMSALGGDPRDEILLDLLTHPKTEVRVAAVLALGSSHEARSQTAVARALEDRDPVVRRAAISALSSYGEAAGLSAVSTALDDDDPKVVLAALDAIGYWGAPMALHALVDKTRDPRPTIAIAAASALGRLGDPRALEPLAGLLDDPRPGLDLAALDALGRLGTSAAIPHLVSVLWACTCEPENLLRFTHAARALGRLHAAEAAGPLVTLMHLHPEVRPAAAEALEGIGPTAIPAVLKALEQAHSPKLERLYLTTLATLGSATADPSMRGSLAANMLAHLTEGDYSTALIVPVLVSSRDPSIVRPLLGVLTDALSSSDGPDRALAEVVLNGLGSVADPPLGQAIVDLVPQMTPPEREAALWLIGRTRSAAGLEMFTQALHTPGLRRAALTGLATMDTPGAGLTLVEELSGSSQTERNLIAMGLGDNAAPEVRQALLARIDSDPGGTLRDILAALGDQRQPLEVPLRDHLRTWATSPDPRTSGRALDLLGSLGDPSDLPFILDALTHGDGESRTKVVQALGQWGRADTLSLLVGASEDPNPRVRAEAAWALGELGDPRSAPTLRRLLSDRRQAVVVNAAAALGQIKDPRAAEALRDLSETGSGPIRANALWARERIGGAGDSTMLLRLVKRDNDPRVAEMVGLLLAQRGSPDDLSVLRKVRRITSTHLRVPTAPQRLRAPEDWTRFVVTDDGEPDPGQPVLIALPDGRLLMRETDINGEVRVELGAPGHCRLFFLDKSLTRVVN